MRPVDAAADRFFRAYHTHCTKPGEDTLFNFLNALHSFHDKFQKATGGDLFGSFNFKALKALRNLFHHEAELLNRVKVVRVDNLPFTTDLGVLCLIDRRMALDAVDRDLVSKRAAYRQAPDRDNVLSTFKWYGSIANIQPCVFNGAVDVFESVLQAQIAPSSPAFSEFAASYRYEEENGFPHRVTGDIHCLAADVNEVVRQLFGQR
jgi:hypothetical protein